MRWQWQWNPQRQQQRNDAAAQVQNRISIQETREMDDPSPTRAGIASYRLPGRAVFSPLGLP